MINNNNDFNDMFEKRLQAFTCAPYVVLTSSCTNAIFLCLMLLRLKKELTSTSKLFVPNKTYLSVPQMLLHNQINFDYVDYTWEEKYNLGYDIYDCAVGFKENMYIASQYQCLSFQQKKTLNIGKGGAILLDNYNDYLMLKRMTHDGRDSSVTTSEDLKNIIMGYHMYMSPDEAAKGILILNQLKTKDFIIGSSEDYPDISKINYN
jgi:dTDP-4-amino-4,6-dideoxygalactose transaminase